MKIKKLITLFLGAVLVASSIAVAGGSDADHIPVEVKIVKEGVVYPVDAVVLADPSGMSHAFFYSFSTKTLGNSKPSGMTLEMNNLVWQTNATFTISGTCTKPTAKLSFELYRQVDGEWIRLARKIKVSCTSNGTFEWNTSYGVDGNYALKVWHNLEKEDVVKITGNLIS